MQLEARRHSKRPSFRTLRNGWRFLRDRKAPVLPKLFLLFAVGYVILPADLIPDFPIVGWLDDAGVLAIALGWIGAKLERYAAEERKEAAPREE